MPLLKASMLYDAKKENQDEARKKLLSIIGRSQHSLDSFAAQIGITRQTLINFIEDRTVLFPRNFGKIEEFLKKFEK